MFTRMASLVVVLLMTLWNTSVYSSENNSTQRVLFLPFDGTAAGPYAYLSDSVATMLAGRVSAAGNVEIVDRALQEAELKKLRAQAGKAAGSMADGSSVDYVISGGLYATQAGLQIQVTLLPIGSKAKEETYSTVAESENTILTSVEELAQELSGKIKGGSRPGPIPAEPEKSGTAGFTTEHPDKGYKKGIYGGGMIVGSDGTESSVKAVGVRRSSPIPAVVVSMAVGDIDGDGSAEIVFASRTALEVYRFDETRFRKISELALSANLKVHAVNLADMDGNGKKEIYVSANDRRLASSAIYSWDEQAGIQPLLTAIPWYLRPVARPGDGYWLIGQQSSSSPETGYVNNSVFRLQLQQGFAGVSSDKVLALPKSLRLFDFEWADITGDGGLETIAVDQRHKLLIYDQHNALLWVSTDDYGGSRNFFGPPPAGDGGGGSDGSDDRTLHYIPTRILVQDVDRDGKMDVIIGRNKLISYKWLANIREFDGGTVACLSWQGSTLQELWRTNNVPGYIADYSFVAAGSTPAPGRVELFVGQVPSRAYLGFMMEKDSNILKYDIDITKP